MDKTSNNETKLKKTKYKYKRYLENTGQKYYYFLDKENKEWQFREINGSALDYYFICTSSKCSDFAILNREKTNQFRITKNHTLENIDILIIKQKLINIYK